MKNLKSTIIISTAILVSSLEASLIRSKIKKSIKKNCAFLAGIIVLSFTGANILATKTSSKKTTTQQSMGNPMSKSTETINGSYFLSDSIKESLVVNGSSHINDSNINTLTVNGSLHSRNLTSNNECIFSGSAHLNDCKINELHSSGSLISNNCNVNSLKTSGSLIANNCDFNLLTTAGSVTANNTKIQSLSSKGSFVLKNCKINSNLIFKTKNNHDEDESDGFFWSFLKTVSRWTTWTTNTCSRELKGSTEVLGNIIFQGDDSSVELHIYDSVKIAGDIVGEFTLILHSKKIIINGKIDEKINLINAF